MRMLSQRRFLETTAEWVLWQRAPASISSACRVLHAWAACGGQCSCCDHRAGCLFCLRRSGSHTERQLNRLCRPTGCASLTRIPLDKQLFGCLCINLDAWLMNLPFVTHGSTAAVAARQAGVAAAAEFEFGKLPGAFPVCHHWNVSLLRFICCRTARLLNGLSDRNNKREPARTPDAAAC